MHNPRYRASFGAMPNRLQINNKTGSRISAERVSGSRAYAPRGAFSRTVNAASQSASPCHASSAPGSMLIASR